MKLWIPRLIMATFALMLVYAVYWGYKNTRPHQEQGHETPAGHSSAAKPVSFVHP